eukprot:gene16177-13142_t
MLGIEGIDDKPAPGWRRLGSDSCAKETASIAVPALSHNADAAAAVHRGLK